jgi:antitoxin ParD1/3/4
MQIDLDPQLEAIIREKVASGRYTNAGEVVRDALLQLQERERRLEELRAAITVADEQVARGEVVEWTPELHADIMRQAKAAAKAGKKPKADVLP